MTDQHPITPPPELVKKWLNEGHHQDYCSASEHAIAQAARWGADQELEAMLAELKALHLPDGYAAKLRAARRPKPPSLKEQAQAELDRLVALIPTEGALAMAEPIRRALEALDD